MVELCNRVDIALLKNIGDDLTAISISTDAFLPVPSVEADAVGIRNKIDISISVDKQIAQVCRSLSLPRRCVVTLYYIDGRSFNIGSKKYPAWCWLNRGVEKDILQIKDEQPRGYNL